MVLKDINLFLVFLIDLVKLCVLGVIRLVKWAIQLLQKAYKKLATVDKLFLLFWGSAMLFLIQEWRSYSIRLAENYTVSRHKIYSDDFLVFVIFMGLAMLLWSSRFTPDSQEEKPIKSLNRLSLLFIIASIVLYGLTLIFPERVAPTDEASFTWQFYAFGVSLVGCLITGYRGITNYAQYPSNA